MNKKILALINLTLFVFVTINTHASPTIHDDLLGINETLILETKDLPVGWAVVSDPELVKIDNQWRMFFNTIELDFDKNLPIHILSASLPPPPGKSLSAGRKKWTVHENPIISLGPEGTWDDHTTETAKYVYGYDATTKEWMHRLYYLGWPNPKGKVRDYRIGFAQYDQASNS